MRSLVTVKYKMQYSGGAMSRQELSGACSAALLMTEDDDLLGEVAGRLRVRGAAPWADPLTHEDHVTIRWIAARSDWEAPALRGYVSDPQGLYLLVTARGSIAARGGRGSELVWGADLEEVAAAAAWPRLVDVVDAALMGRATKASEAGWWAHAVPLHDAGAVVVMVRQ